MLEAGVRLAGVSLFVYTLFGGIFQLTYPLTQVIALGQLKISRFSPQLNYRIFLEEQSIVDGRVFCNAHKPERIDVPSAFPGFCEKDQDAPGDRVARRIGAGK